MKRLISLLLIFVFIFSLTSCAGKTDKKLPKGATEDEANYPKKEKNNSVVNDNETGMIYNFTLDKFTTEFNTMYSELGGDYKEFPYKKWKKRSSEKQANGKLYNYMYLVSKEVVLTATEEDETRHLVNIGCGITVKKFNSSQELKSRVMTICGIMASVAGGYSKDSVNFFGNLFVDTISSDDNSFWYEDSIYHYDKETASDGRETILFRVMPAESNIEDKWNLQDYKDYWFNN